MPPLPLLSAKQLIKALSKIGYQAVRQKGSHIRLINIDFSKKPTTVPNHKLIGRGLLRKILRDIDLTADEFSELLEK